MALTQNDLILKTVKGSALTITEADNNFAVLETQIKLNIITTCFLFQNGVTSAVLDYDDAPGFFYQIPGFASPNINQAAKTITLAIDESREYKFRFLLPEKRCGLAHIRWDFLEQSAAFVLPTTRADIFTSNITESLNISTYEYRVGGSSPGELITYAPHVGAVLTQFKFHCKKTVYEDIGTISTTSMTLSTPHEVVDAFTMTDGTTIQNIAYDSGATTAPNLYNLEPSLSSGVLCTHRSWHSPGNNRIYEMVSDTYEALFIYDEISHSVPYFWKSPVKQSAYFNTLAVGGAGSATNFAWSFIFFNNINEDGGTFEYNFWLDTNETPTDPQVQYTKNINGFAIDGVQVDCNEQEEMHIIITTISGITEVFKNGISQGTAASFSTGTLNVYGTIREHYTISELSETPNDRYFEICNLRLYAHVQNWTQTDIDTIFELDQQAVVKQYALAGFGTIPTPHKGGLPTADLDGRGFSETLTVAGDVFSYDYTGANTADCYAGQSAAIEISPANQNNTNDDVFYIDTAATGQRLPPKAAFLEVLFDVEF